MVDGIRRSVNKLAAFIEFVELHSDHSSEPSQARLELRPQPLLNVLGSDPHAELVYERTGVLDHDAVSALLNLTEEACLAASDPVSLRKRIMALVVEGVENVHHHTDETRRHTAYVALVRTPSRYMLMVGNAMPVVAAAMLTQRVEMLNDMDEATLKAQYIALLANDGRTNKGGAGLGLITMARKSTRPMHVASRPVEAGWTNFTLVLTVERAQVAGSSEA